MSMRQKVHYTKCPPFVRYECGSQKDRVLVIDPFLI